MLSDHQRITWHRNIAENFNRLSRVHERYRRQTTDDRQTTDRQTDGRRQIANVNMSSRSLKMILHCYVFPVLKYSFKSWTMNNELVRRINAFEF